MELFSPERNFETRPVLFHLGILIAIGDKKSQLKKLNSLKNRVKSQMKPARLACFVYSMSRGRVSSVIAA